MTTENPLTAIDAKWLNSIWGWHLTSIKTLNEEYLERRQQRQPVVAGCMLLPVDIWAAATSVAAATAAAATKKKGTFAATPKSGVFRWERLLHRNPGQLGRDLTSCRSGPELCNNRTGSGPQICKSRVTGDVTLRGWTTRRQLSKATAVAWTSWFIVFSVRSPVWLLNLIPAWWCNIQRGSVVLARLLWTHIVTCLFVVANTADLNRIKQ